MNEYEKRGDKTEEHFYIFGPDGTAEKSISTTELEAERENRFKIKKKIFPITVPYSEAISICGGENSYKTGDGHKKDFISATSINRESLAITLYDISHKKAAIALLTEFYASETITVDNIVTKMLEHDFFKDIPENQYLRLEAAIIGNGIYASNINKIKKELQKREIAIIGEDLENLDPKSKYVFLQCATGNIEVYLNQSETEEETKKDTKKQPETEKETKKDTEN